MKNKEYVYFLTIEEARKLAEKHAKDKDWDIWNDPVAQTMGFINYIKAQKCTRRAS